MKKRKDLTGLKFGLLSVIKQAEDTSTGTAQWVCECECGTMKTVRANHLIQGDTQSCGCRVNGLKDLTGMKFNSLTVIERYKNTDRGDAQWLCECDCGNVKLVKSSYLITGAVKNCGHRKKAKLTMPNKNRLYRIWSGMKTRCYKPGCMSYRYYGERGIAVCDEWFDDFTAFYNWAMLHGYADNLSIDRIDNYKGYSPDNCRWATALEQAHNKRKKSAVA